MEYYLSLAGFILTYLGAALTAGGAYLLVLAALDYSRDQRSENFKRILRALALIALGALSFFAETRFTTALFFVLIAAYFLYAGINALRAPSVYSLPVSGEYLGPVTFEQKPEKKTASAASYLRFRYEIEEDVYEGISKDDVSGGLSAAYREGNPYRIYVDPKHPENFRIDPKSERVYGILAIPLGILFLLAAFWIW